MGVMKQWLIEQAEQEAKENEGCCCRCGCDLTSEELETGRDECFDCYCDAQD